MTTNCNPISAPAADPTITKKLSHPARSDIGSAMLAFLARVLAMRMPIIGSRRNRADKKGAATVGGNTVTASRDREQSAGQVFPVFDSAGATHSLCTSQRGEGR